MGSNSEFLRETTELSTWLDVERIYLLSGDENQALRLMPLLQVGPSPSSARNACYFYSRVEKSNLRYVSYHYIDQPERYLSVKEAKDLSQLLELNGKD